MRNPKSTGSGKNTPLRNSHSERSHGSWQHCNPSACTWAQTKVGLLATEQKMNAFWTYPCIASSTPASTNILSLGNNNSPKGCCCCCCWHYFSVSWVVVVVDTISASHVLLLLLLLSSNCCCCVIIWSKWFRFKTILFRQNSRANLWWSNFLLKVFYRSFRMYIPMDISISQMEYMYDSYVWNMCIYKN